VNDIGAWILVVVLAAGMIVSWLIYRRNHPARENGLGNSFLLFVLR